MLHPSGRRPVQSKSMISWQVLHHSGHPFQGRPVQVAIHDIITGTSPLWEGPHSSLVQGVLQYNICLNSLDHRPPFSSRLTQHRLSHTHTETLSNTPHTAPPTLISTTSSHFLHRQHTHTHSYQLLQLHQNNGGLHQALKPHLPTQQYHHHHHPTRRPSRFTEDIFGHELTRITSHDYDCALGIEGGNCEVLPTTSPLQPTVPSLPFPPQSSHCRTVSVHRN